MSRAELHHLCPPFLFSSGSALLCVLPDSYTTWASCSTSVLVQKCSVASILFSHVCRFPNSSFCWIVGVCCVLLAVAFHGLPTHRFKNCKSQTLSPSTRLTQRVFMSTAETHRCGQAYRQKLLASTSCSTWLHPQSGFAPSTLFWSNFCLARSCP